MMPMRLRTRSARSSVPAAASRARRLVPGLTLVLGLAVVASACSNCAESHHVSSASSGTAKAGAAPASAGAAPAKAGATAPAQTGAAPAAAAAPKVAATGPVKKRDTKSYTLEIQAPPTLSQGHPGAAAIQVLPKPGWHVNNKYPIKLSVTAPSGTKVAKAVQRAKDATAFDKRKAAFNVAFTAQSPGSKAFKANLMFAVCNPTSCVPRREKLAWTVVVK